MHVNIGGKPSFVDGAALAVDGGVLATIGNGGWAECREFDPTPRSALTPD